MTFDVYIFQLINQFAGKWFWLDNLAIFFAEYFGYLLTALVFLFFWRKWKIIFQAFFAAILARLIFVNFIRWLIPRTRPFVENNINLLLEPKNTLAFPSGHAGFYFALSTIIYFYNKKIGVLFYLASFLISFARVFSGVHWLSDIIVGALVGIFSGYLVIVFSRKFFPDNGK